MALPQTAFEGFTANEIAFCAEDEPIIIIPNQALDPLELAGWRSPALRPLRRATVPLWFAMLLRKQDRCRVVLPEWLEESRLRQLAEQERADQSRFADLPWMWQPISQILLKDATDDVQGDVDELMQLLQDLRELRQAKVRAGLPLVNESHLRMDGLGAMEINEVKPVLGRTMRLMQKIRESVPSQ